MSLQKSDGVGEFVKSLNVMSSARKPAISIPSSKPRGAQVAAE